MFVGPVFLASLFLACADQISLQAKQQHNASPLELSGFSISEAYEIQDDIPLDLDSPTLKQLLYRIKNTSPKSRNQYSRYSKDVTWHEITNQTEDFRLWMFDIPARLKKIEKRRFQTLSAEEEIKGVNVCYCETDPHRMPGGKTGRGDTFLVLSRTMPNAIPVGVSIDEPIRVSGFLYARVSGTDVDDNNEMPVFITDRVAWFPDQESKNVTAAHVSLAKHGVDIGLIDIVRASNARTLDSRDAESFFQFLAAADRMDGNKSEQISIAENPKPDSSKLGFNQLMQNSDANFGQAVRIAGTVRTCSVINVPHADIKSRMGLTKYYQLMLFPNLDGTKIVVTKQDGTKMDYRRFPVTVCCLELPAGMSPTDVEKKRFVVDGYFFRFWKYQSDKTDQAAVSGQVSPLIIAKIPRIVDLDTGGLNLALLIFAITIIGAMIALIGGYKIADRKRRSPIEKILDTLPEQMDLSGLED